MLHPRHRGDCADLFSTPDQSEHMQLDITIALRSAIEHAAARAGRTWNAQLTYIMGLFLGDHAPDFEDGRSVEDWRTLLRPCALRFSEAEDWIPFSCLRRRTP